MKRTGMMLQLFVLLGLCVWSGSVGAQTGSSRAEAAQAVDAALGEMLALVRRAEAAAEESRREAASARARVEELERQIAALRESLAVSTGDRKTTQPVAGQTPSDPAASLSTASASPSDDRLTRIEEQVEINSAQIREQAQTKVESDSRFRVRLSGMLLANFSYNSDGIQRTLPLFAPPSAGNATRGAFGSSFRQTRLGLAMTGPRIGSARLSAEADFDFYGGTVAVFEGDLLGSLRIRTAAARLDWERTSLLVGQEAPIISPRNPTSLAAVWYAPLSGAGNLWQWRPQATVEHRFRGSDDTDWIAQASVLPPFGDGVSGGSFPAVPAYEARFAWRRRLDAERTAEVGVGVHYGRRDFDSNRNVNGYVAAGDWALPIGERVELSGEIYHGRAIALSEQSGGRLDRIYAFNGPIENSLTRVRGVRSSGGWAQASFKARRDLEFNLAYGQEDPNNADLRFGSLIDVTRLKNQAAFINTIYQWRPNFLVSLEYRRLMTDYAAGRQRNNHYNLAVAYVF